MPVVTIDTGVPWKVPVYVSKPRWLFIENCGAPSSKEHNVAARELDPTNTIRFAT